MIGVALDKVVRLVVLLSPPELRNKREQLLKLLPDIEDQPGREAEIEIDPAELQAA